MTAKKKKPRPKKRPSAAPKRKQKAVFSGSSVEPQPTVQHDHQKRQSAFLAAHAKAVLAALDIKDALRRRDEDQQEMPWWHYIQPRGES